MKYKGHQVIATPAFVCGPQGVATIFDVRLDCDEDNTDMLVPERLQNRQWAGYGKTQEERKTHAMKEFIKDLESNE